MINHLQPDSIGLLYCIWALMANIGEQKWRYIRISCIIYFASN